jgi:type I restriction enzyme, S subunit
MSAWKTVELREVAEFIRGINFKPDDVVPVGTPGSVACMRTKNVQAELDCSDVWGVDERFVKREDQFLETGDILVSSANSWNLVGKCCWIPDLPWRATFGGFVSVLRPHRAKTDPRFLFHWFSSNRIQTTLRSFGQQTTNISNLNTDRCLKLPLPLPPLAEQGRIAELLDRAEALRDKRRAAISRLHTLPQSIFLDLFGDPATNPKGWQRAKLGDAIFSASDGPHVSPTYSDDGIPFVSTRHVREGEITWEDLKFISREDAEIHWRKCRPEFGDVLYTKGGTTGLAVAVETDKPFALWVHVALLKPNSTKVDSTWLESMLNTRFCYRQSQDLTHGIANRDLGLTRMVKIDIFLPPLTLQQEFARRVASLKKMRTAYRASLAEMEALFASFQHRAFRGEL